MDNGNESNKIYVLAEGSEDKLALLHGNVRDGQEVVLVLDRVIQKNVNVDGTRSVADGVEVTAHLCLNIFDLLQELQWFQIRPDLIIIIFEIHNT
jgi:hypothetical protein